MTDFHLDVRTTLPAKPAKRLGALRLTALICRRETMAAYAVSKMKARLLRDAPATF